jgi:hypothetical protein
MAGEEAAVPQPRDVTIGQLRRHIVFLSNQLAVRQDVVAAMTSNLVEAQERLQLAHDLITSKDEELASLRELALAQHTTLDISSQRTRSSFE